MTDQPTPNEHQFAFDLGAPLAQWADALGPELTATVGERCHFESITRRDGGLVLAGILTAATDALDADREGPLAFAYLSVADALARAMLAACEVP